MTKYGFHPVQDFSRVGSKGEPESAVILKDIIKGGISLDTPPFCLELAGDDYFSAEAAYCSIRHEY